VSRWCSSASVVTRRGLDVRSSIPDRKKEIIFATASAPRGDRQSVVGIATFYGLDGPRIESRWGQDFSHPSRPALRPPILLYNGYRVFPGPKADGVWR
jgi:hypothetical protein